MKRLVVVLAGLLSLPAFADIDARYFYNEIPEYRASQDADTATEDTSVTRTTARNAATRATPSGRANTGATTRATTSRREDNTTNRGTIARTGAVTTPTRTTTQSVVTRGTAPTRTTVSRNAAPTRDIATTRASVQHTNGVTARTNTFTEPTNIGRVGVRSTNVVSRIPTIRAASTLDEIDAATPVTTAADMDTLAQTTDFCKAQYMACMDSYCNKLDDERGRCVCSSNLKNYEKTENALAAANESLQEVAVQLNFLAKDMTAEQINALYTQTEAELVLSKSSDNSQIKNSLDAITEMLVAVQSGRATASGAASNTFDTANFMAFDFDSDMFNLDTLLGNGTKNNVSIANQRGTQLYKTATQQCKTSVLNTCAAQGVDTAIITNAYDLEIDKHCIAYEGTLAKANDQAANRITTAKIMLQLARLNTSENKNLYNLRECVTELDNCMQGDFVCGEDYENCLDPSGKYIVNGELVPGSIPGTQDDTNGLYKTWTYNSTSSPWINDGTMSAYIDATVKEGAAITTSDIMSEFLQNKIGYHDDKVDRDYGMCMDVLNKCQKYTYDDTGKNAEYIHDNTVIKEYLQRTMTQIKARQDTIIAEYAEDCVQDVQQCMAANGYDEDNSTTKNTTAIRACLQQIKTCYSVTVTKDDTGYAESPTFATYQTWAQDAVNSQDQNTQQKFCAPFAMFSKYEDAKIDLAKAEKEFPNYTWGLQQGRATPTEAFDTQNNPLKWLLCVHVDTLNQAQTACSDSMTNRTFTGGTILAGQSCKNHIRGPEDAGK